MRLNIETPISKYLLLLLLNIMICQLFGQSNCRDVEVITTPQNTSERNINPSVSCDGQAIVWRGNDGTSNLIYLADCDGHVTLVSDQTVINTRPQISADGSTIVWAGYTVGDDFALQDQNIYMSVNGGPQTLVSPVTPTGTSINNDTPQVCADGSKIVWRGYLGNTEHVFMNDGNQTTQISTIASSRNSTPQISDDCSIITWMGFDATTNSYQIFMYENGIVQNISSPNGSIKSYNQVLSSDGQVIVWIGLDQNGFDQIYMYQNNQLTQVTNNMPGRHMYPSVSNDGTTISWSNYNELTSTTNVYVYTPNGIVLVDSYNITAPSPVFLTTSVSESGNSIVWADPNENIIKHTFSNNQTQTLASGINLFDQALQISCNEQVVVWASYVTDYNTNINRSICANSFCEPCGGACPQGYECDGIECALIDSPGFPDSPPATEIPTMGEWGLICLSILFLIFGIQSIRQTHGRSSSARS